MTIRKEQNGTALTIYLEGRLDTTTAPELEEELKTALDAVTELTVDLGKLDYMSSAGLRVMLSTQKRMNRQGSMTVVNVNDVLMEIFEVTGFDTILDIK